MSDLNSPRRITLENLAFAFSFANLRMVQTWELLLHRRYEILELPHFDSSYYAAALCTLALLTLLAWVLVTLLRATANRWFKLALVTVLLIGLIRPVNFVLLQLSMLFDVDVPSMLRLVVGVIGVTVVSWACLVRPQWLKLGFVGVAILAPWAALHAANCFWHIATDTAPASTSAATNKRGVAQPRDSRSRVIWIIFDELDYRLVFDEPPPGLSLANLNRLRKESFFATQTQEPGPHTLRAVPSLLMGRQVAASQKDHVNQDLLLRFDLETGESVSLRDGRNVFALAREAGARVGIVADFFPYCVIFGDSVDSCHQWFIAYKTRFERNSLLNLVMSMFYRQIPNHHVGEGAAEIEAHFSRAKREALRHDLDLVVMHFALPHSPFVYDREKGRYVNVLEGESTYFDNLALVDEMLGTLRQTMEGKGLWDSTHIILMADHGWRASNDGVRDRRVPYLVKVAGESDAMEWDAPLDVYRTRDLVLSLLGGNVDSVNEVAQFFEARGATENN